MSSKGGWVPRQHEPGTSSYHAYETATLVERLRDPSVVIPALILVVTVLYSCNLRLLPQQQQHLGRLGRFLWDALVAITPARLLHVLDAWLDPPLFPRPMPPAPANSHAAKSDLMRKILGMDAFGGGIIATVSQAGRRLSGFGGGGLGGGGSGFSFSKVDSGQPAGLGNISNSCYQNSILQGLASLKPLPGYLRVPTTTTATGPRRPNGAAASSSPSSAAALTSATIAAAGGMKTAGTLRDLIADLNDTANNGRTLWTPAILKNMSTWQQQDAQEYFSKLLDEVDSEIAKATKVVYRGHGFEGAADALSSSPSSSPSPPPSSSASVSSSCGAAVDEDGTAASQHSDDSGYQSLSTTISKQQHRRRQQQHKAALGGGPAAAAEKAPPLPLRNPLEGLVAQRVACVSCGWSEGLSMIPFNCITLNLGMDRHEHDLFERLDAYTRVEAIPGVECGKCTLLKARRLIGLLIERSLAAVAEEGAGKDDGSVDEEAAGASPLLAQALSRLRAIEEALEEDDFDDVTITKRCKITQKVSSTKTKQAVIARAPQSLVVHMNRSVFDEGTGQMFKNLSAVRFPMVLDLGPWCLGSADKSTASRPNGVGGGGPDGRGHHRPTDKEQSTPPRREGPAEGETEEQWLLDPRSSMVAGDLHPSRITGPIYELRAVVTHYGRHENGHYVCYRKHPRPRATRSSHGRGRNTAPDPKPAAAPPNLAAEGRGGEEDEKAVGDRLAVGGRPRSADGERRQPSVSELDDSSSPDTSLALGGRTMEMREEEPDEADDGEEEESGWWRLSDQNVTPVTEDLVLSQGGVFMLFYDCVDPIPVLTSSGSEAVPSSSSPPARDPRQGGEERTSPSTPTTTAWGGGHGPELVEDTAAEDPSGHPGSRTTQQDERESLHCSPGRAPPPPQQSDPDESLRRAQNIPLPLEDDGGDEGMEWGLGPGGCGDEVGVRE